MGSYTTQAIVLNSKSFGEADRILTLLTYERGKVRAVARGARRPRNRLAAVTQPISHVEVQIMEGNQLDTLNQGQLINTYRFLKEDLDKLSYATYLAELFEKATEGATELRDYFVLLLTALEIVQNFENLKLTRFFIEAKLIVLQGYAPSLSNCIHCNRDMKNAEPQQQMLYSPESGGLYCPQCFPGGIHVKLTVREIRFWQELMKQDPRWLIAQQPEQAMLEAVGKALAAALTEIFGALPKSASFLQTLSEL